MNLPGRPGVPRPLAEAIFAAATRLPSLRNGGSSGCVDALSANEGSFEGLSLRSL